jgi:hypothetical protein
MDRKELESHARAKLLARELPLERPATFWAGYGLGDRACVLCTESIMREQVELEVKADDGRTLFYHAPCFDVLNDVYMRLKEDELK